MLLIGLCFIFTPEVSAEQDGDYNYTVSNGEATIIKYTGAGGAISIPLTLGGYPTVSIGYKAFYYCTSLTSVNIPNSVTSIGYQAFYSCTSLTSVTIPDLVTSVGDNAFAYCSSLSSVTIGNSVNTIGDNAFYYCSSLNSVIIGNSVTSIGNSAFAYCSLLKSIVIPDSVTSVGYNAFAYCSSLASAIIGNSVTSIEYTTFAYCSSLISLTIGNSVTTIGNSAFAYCSSLTNVTIPNSVTTIEDNAFYYCTSLTSVTLGTNVSIIKNGAFHYCSILTSITFLGLVAPTTVESSWIPGTPENIRGHAYETSNFPLPGGVWNGLTMGTMLKGSGIDENEIPLADFTWKPSNPKPNEEIIFDVSWSYDPNGSIVLYEWDWNNDGIYEESHTSLTAVHKWSQIGNYPVTLRVTDNDDAISTKTITVSVEKGSGIPGFELVFVLCAIVISIILWKKIKRV